RLILLPFSRENGNGANRKTRTLGKSIKKALFVGIFILIPVAFIFPNHAFAGIFSVFKEIFAADKTQLTYTANSQTLALLEPAKTAAPATGGAEVSILEGSALDPDTSYSGEGEAFKPKNDQISI